MWCHLCNLKFTNQENFKVHIMKNHRPASEFYDESDSENSEEEENENDESCDDIDESGEDMMEDEVDEETGNFSSGESSCDMSQTHVDTTPVNIRRKTKKESDLKDKMNLRLADSKSDHKTVGSELIDNNKILYIMNPVTSQETKDSSLKSQSIEQPMFMFNNVSDQLPLPNIRGGFEFSPRNVLIWLVKFKEMCRTLKFPVQRSVFEKIRTVHRGIFDYYSTANSSELTLNLLKVYEELDNMIHKHITSINEQL